MSQRQRDVELQDQYIAEENKKANLREEQFNLRLKKIQDKMDRMADTVVRNEREQILAEEKRLLKLQMEREERLQADAYIKKIQTLEHNKMVNKQLTVQMDEKLKVKEEQIKADKRYKHMLQNEHDIIELKEQNKKQEHQNSLMDNKNYILSQQEQRKMQINREMNENEERLNKTFINKLDKRNMI